MITSSHTYKVSECCSIIELHYTLLGVVFFLRNFKFRSLWWVAFLLVSVLVASCADRTGTPANSPVKSQTSELDRELLAEQFPTFDEQLVQVAEIVPSFAGFFYNDDGKLIIASTGDLQLPVIQTAIRTVFGNDLLDLASGSEVLSAQYSFLELADWRASARELFSEPGVVYLDIDETRNRIVFGIQNLETSEGLEQKLVDLGVPLAAVLFERADIPETGVTLREVNSPRVGSVQIGNPGGGYCTMGFNATHNSNPAGARGFITNSHCSEFLFQDETTGFFDQPSGGPYIGQEHIDEEPFSGGDCPSGEVCRYSDSIFVRYSSSVSSTKQVAATDRAMVGGPRNYEVNRLLAVYDTATPIVNRSVHKIGARTDHSSGNVVSTCVDVSFSNSGVKLLCQTRAEYHHDKGDSGSPVYRISSQGGPLGVDLFGLHWGGYFPGDAFFSPANNVFRDLGGMDYTYDY